MKDYFLKNRQFVKIFTIIFLLSIVGFHSALHVQAQNWPPFTFRLAPTHENGKITYKVTFRTSRAIDWDLRNVRIHIPLPEGTRFIDAGGTEPATVSFDGAEIRFFSHALPKKDIRDAFFEVEVLDPSQVNYETNAWISWEGDVPGAFISRNFKINTSYQSVDWVKPAGPRLDLRTVVTTKDGVTTYLIYPTKGRARMWDVQINMPIPPGATLLAAEAPSPFVVGSNEEVVVFSVIEFEGRITEQPLKIELSTPPNGNAYVSQIWANWKNAGKNVGLTVPPEEATNTPEIVVLPNHNQTIIPDHVGDAPFVNYDMATIGLQDVLLPDGQQRAVKIRFRAASLLGDKTEALEYIFYVDADCWSQTGNNIKQILGADLQIQYRHNSGKAYFSAWDNVGRKWDRLGQVPVDAPATGDMVTFWLSHDLLPQQSRFCWLGQTHYKNARFGRLLEIDYLPNVRDIRLQQYFTSIGPVERETSVPAIKEAAKGRKQSSPPIINTGFDWKYLPGWASSEANWTLLDFDDGHWFTGPTPIGYDADATDGLQEFGSDLALATPDAFDGEVPVLIRYINPRTGSIVAVPETGQERMLYLRHSFVLTNPTALTELKLEVAYKDGFVAYLNGTEIARRGLGQVGTNITFDRWATKPNRRTNARKIDISEHLGLLIEGTNVLAIQVHRSEVRPQLFIDAVLR